MVYYAVHILLLHILMYWCKISLTKTPLHCRLSNQWLILILIFLKQINKILCACKCTCVCVCACNFWWRAIRSALNISLCHSETELFGMYRENKYRWILQHTINWIWCHSVFTFVNDCYYYFFLHGECMFITFFILECFHERTVYLE